ncbi:MAG: hypothetical protein RBG13Loki_0192 [Promethearchaeota archaeon CR_4]|nr:MAG: hypothetical protein RBG13Loki_0192 [Candidatus Lokiarchaeota archaeon CR_4]
MLDEMTNYTIVLLVPVIASFILLVLKGKHHIKTGTPIFESSR